MNPSNTNQPGPFQGQPAAAPQNQPNAVPQLDPTSLPRDAASRFVPPLTNPNPPSPPPAPPRPAAVTPPVPTTPASTSPPPAAPSQPVVGKSAGQPAKKKNDNSTQNSLQIAEIRDGIVIMNDGSYRSVVMVKSINFDLMSPQEQEAVEYSYQGFLNSLYFPIQIYLRSQKVDLQPYIAKLDKIRTEHDNMLLALLMEDYITYIDDLSQHTNIMDKKFYVVIPFYPVVDAQKALTQSKNFLAGLGGLLKSKDQHVVINEADLENAKTELRNRVQAVLSGLQQASIQGLPLDTQELIELYYDSYNPDTATRQQLKNFDDLSADVITRGTGVAPQPHLQRELK